MWRQLEAAFAALSLLFLSGGLFPLLYGEWSATGRRAFIATLYLLAAGLLARRWPETEAALRRCWPALLPVGLAVASISWSAAPRLSAVWSLGLVGTCLLGLFLACAFSTDQQLQLLVATLALAGAAGVLVAWLWPATGLMGSEAPGALRGTFSHKNLFGRAMATAGLACLASRCAGRLTRSGLALGWLTLLALSLASRSASAVALLLSGLASAVVLTLLKPLARRITWAALLAAAVAALAAGQSSSHAVHEVLERLGKDQTIEVRIELWGIASEAARLRPWLGHGFAAFWPGAALEIPELQTLRWHPEHGHNGFLDLTLELGLLGLALFLVPFLVQWTRSAGLSLVPGPPRALWPWLFLLTLFLGNLVESSLLRANRLDYALYVALLASSGAGSLAAGARQEGNGA